MLNSILIEQSIHVGLFCLPIPIYACDGLGIVDGVPVIINRDQAMRSYQIDAQTTCLGGYYYDRHPGRFIIEPVNKRFES